MNIVATFGICIFVENIGICSFGVCSFGVSCLWLLAFSDDTKSFWFICGADLLALSEKEENFFSPGIPAFPSVGALSFAPMTTFPLHSMTSGPPFPGGEIPGIHAFGVALGVGSLGSGHEFSDISGGAPIGGSGEEFPVGAKGLPLGVAEHPRGVVELLKVSGLPVGGGGEKGLPFGVDTGGTGGGGGGTLGGAPL